MPWRTYSSLFLCAFMLGARFAIAQSTQATIPTTLAAIPDEFIDPETHLRVIHLSRLPNDRSGVIYFTYPCITADSKIALIDTQFEDKWRHLYAFDFASMALSPLVVDRFTQNQVLAPKSGNLYYLADNAAWVINIRGGAPRKITDLPAKWVPGAGFSVNADETLLLGGSSDVDRPAAAPTTQRDPAAPPASSFESSFEKHDPHVLFTINIQSGEVKVIHRINTWLGHVQFSPTDPDLLMYCHEGPWEKVDRIWMLRLSKGDPYLLYKRTEPREIVGHEFWAPDGKSVWFQQSFRDRGTNFLTSQNLETGKLTQMTIPEGGRSIHYTFTPDGSFLIGDGSGTKPTGPNKYLSALIPQGDHVQVIKLCTLQKNDYKIEPNPHVSPDNRWVIFTATLFGTPQAYAVELPHDIQSLSHTN